jgi:hypothetical protein
MLSDAIQIDRKKTYKGTAWVLYGSLASFPGELESVINPTTYVKAAGLTELCPTTEDGVTVTRAAEVSDGIAIDQKATNLDEGEPTGWGMGAAFELLDTTLDALKIVWQTGDPVAITGSSVSQKRLSLGAPQSFTERELYIVQEDAKTKRMRVFAFRKAVPQVDSELNAQSEEASGTGVEFKIRADTTKAEHHGPFGFIFEEDA